MVVAGMGWGRDEDSVMKGHPSLKKKTVPCYGVSRERPGDCVPWHSQAVTVYWPLESSYPQRGPDILHLGSFLPTDPPSGVVLLG